MNPHGGQDWFGFAVVMGVLLVLSALAYADTWRTQRRVHHPETGIVIRRAKVSDLVVHATCAHPSCKSVVCFCITLDGPCPGTVEPGCWHYKVTSVPAENVPAFCVEHADYCDLCAVEDRSGWGSVR